MDFDYAAARKAGYTDDQILDGLQTAGRLDFDLTAARKSGYSSRDILQSLYGNSAQEPAAAEPESSSLLRRAGDVGISALKGIIGVPEALVGLADIPTGGAAGRAAEAAGVKFAQSKELLSDLYSPEQKAANQKVAEAEGFMGTAGAMLSNPSTIAQTAIESIPQMGLGGAIGRGVLAAAPKIGALGAAAIGEGAVGGGTAAEQIRQQSGGDLSLGQAGAALASGVGTGIFGLVGGRLAQKLGVADIDTALVQAGAPAGSTKGVIRRMLEGGISEGVFEEVPQSIQEQIWQNAAMDKPLLDGVPEAAAQGLLVGGLFGGVAGGALHGKADAPAATDPQTGQPLLLGNTPDPFISFPDGSVGRKSEFDAFLNGLPEDQRAAARARFMGYEAQPVTAEDVLQSESVDQAIEVAQRAVAEGSPEFQAQRGAEIDAAWSAYMRERAAQMQAELTAAEQQRRDADVPAMQAQLADQQVAQAEALTRAQGFDDAAPPTAMQSAMQAAQGKRQQMIEAARQRQRAGESDAAWQSRTAEISADRQGQFDQASAARDRQDSVMAQIQATQQQTDLANSISADLGTPAVQPTAMQLAMQEAAAKRRAITTPGAADVPPIPVDAAAPADAGPAGNPAGAAALAPAVDTPIPAADSTATAGRRTETAAADVEQARAILTAAGVTGNDRMAALRSIRTGENTLDDLIDAHPPKGPRNDTDTSAAGVSVPDVATGRVETPAQQRDIAAVGLPAGAEPAAAQSAGAAPAAVPGQPDLPGADGAAGPASPAALSDRAASTASAITGRQIDSEWNEFTPESGTLNIDRNQMPQVKAEHRGALVNFLAARGVTHEPATEMPASDLKPTQREFSREKVAKARGYQGGDRSILVSSDNHVLDGHHQWMAKMEAGEPVKVIRLNAPIRELLDQVHDFPSSQVSEGASSQVMDEETYLATNGASRQGFGDAALHRSSSNVSESSRKAAIERQSRSDTELNARREQLRAEYRSKVESGELRAPTLGEETERIAQGDPDSEATQAAKRLIEKRARRQAERDAESGAGDEARSSTGAEPARGMPAAEVTRAIARLRAKWVGFTKVEVVQSVDELPADLRDAAGDDSLTEGLYDPRTGTAYLIADNLASPERAAWVASHEIVGHGGLRMLNDQTVRQAMKMAGANRFIRDLGAAIQTDRGAGTNEVTALEEAVAELAAATETGDFAGLEARYGVTVPAAARPGIRGVVARVVAAVRQFLATVTGQPVEEVSDADVFDLISQQQAAVEGRRPAPRRASAEPARASIPANQRTIEVDGERRPINYSDGKPVADDFAGQVTFWRNFEGEVDSRGRPIRSDSAPRASSLGQTASAAFKRWFGNSKAVDAKGRPLVVYHGTTADFDGFTGNRFYFTAEPEYASKYAGDITGSNVRPSYLSIERPLDITDLGTGDLSEQTVLNALAAKGVDVRGLRGLVKHKDGSSNIGVWAWWHNPDVISAVKKSGFDSIVQRETTGAGTTKAYIVFERNQIKSATGNNGDFDPNNESILASRAPAAGTERIPKWAESLSDEQKNALRKSGAIYSEKTMRQKLDELRDGALKKMQYGIFDQFAPIKDQLGRVPYIMARMAKSADGTLEAMMLYGRPHLDADGGMLVDTTKKGFIETMQSLNGEHDQFFSWLAGKRAAQLKKEGRENLFTDTDISSLATLNQGTMKDGTSREAAYLRAQKDVAELNKSVLDIAEASGLIDAESRRVWASDFYVPFFRVMEEGITGPSIKSGLVNQKSVKKLKGGTNNLNDLTKNMLMNWSTLLTASAKNRAAKASLDVAAGMGVASEAPESTIKAMAKSAKTRAVSYMEGGATRWFVVEDEHLLAAISALEFNGYNNNAMRAMSWFKNALTRAITVSPYFKVRNLIRDSASVIAISDVSRNPYINLKNGWSLMRDNDARAQMVAGGGIYRFGMTMEGNRAENVKRMIDDGVPEHTILNTAEKMAKFTRKLWSAYEEVGDLSENLNRAALYKKLRSEGVSHLEASFEARDLMDFGLSGAWAGVRALNAVLPFFAARLAGIYRLGRGYNDDPKRMGYVIGALAMATIALSAIYKDDDDWKKRSDSDRNNYWWFKVGSTAFRIPKPFEVGAAATAIDHFAALFYDSENTNAERFQHQMGELINGQLAMNPIPQVFRPLIDVYSNKDAFTGRPIESQAMQRLRPEDRYSSNTSELARLLGKSGILVDPVSLVAGTGVKQLSPVQIDSLVKGYFAGVGVLAVSAVDGLLHHTLIDRGAALPVPLRAMTGSFVEELPTNSSRYVDMLYKTAQDVEQTYASYQNAIKQGDIEKARAIQRDEGTTLAKYHMIESLKKNESRINQVIQRVRDDKLLTGEQKEEQIRRLKIVQDRIARQMVTGK